MPEYVVLSARPYDFTNNRNERVTGLKLSYINPTVKQDGVIGYEPMIASVPSTFEESIVEVPGRYHMGFEVVTGPKNKPQLQLSQLKFVEPIQL